jgi:hypothetical protein
VGIEDVVDVIVAVVFNRSSVVVYPNAVNYELRLKGDQ